MKKNNKLGFSLIELVVVIAILAVIAALLAPALVQYVEDSRAGSDFHTTDEIVNAVQLGIAKPACFDEVADASINGNVSCYIDADYESGKTKSITRTDANGTVQYKFSDDHRIIDAFPYSAAGIMYGLTITFEPDTTLNDATYKISDAIVNKYAGWNIKLSNYPTLYNAIRSVVGETVLLDSHTYRNSSFTVFIHIGDSGNATEVYGQYNGTNLPDSPPVKGTVPDRDGSFEDTQPVTPSNPGGGGGGGTPVVPTPPTGGGSGGGSGQTPTPTPETPDPDPDPEPETPGGGSGGAASCTHTNTTTTPAQSATCQQGGTTEGIVCNDCGEVIKVVMTSPKAPHSYDQWRIVDAANHERSCVWCGRVDSGAHSLTTIETSAATCTQGGTVTKECSACKYRTTETGDPLDHMFDTFTPIDDAIHQISCSQSGCGETAVGGHIYDTVRKEATCTEDGFIKNTCALCGHVFESKLPAHGHEDKNPKDDECDYCFEPLEPEYETFTMREYIPWVSVPYTNDSVYRYVFTEDYTQTKQPEPMSAGSTYSQTVSPNAPLDIDKYLNNLTYKRSTWIIWQEYSQSHNANAQVIKRFTRFEYFKNEDDDTLENAVYAAAFRNRTAGAKFQYAVAMWNGSHYVAYNADAQIQAITDFTEVVDTYVGDWITVEDTYDGYWRYVDLGEIKFDDGMTWGEWQASSNFAQEEPVIVFDPYTGNRVGYNEVIDNSKEYGCITTVLDGTWTMPTSFSDAPSYFSLKNFKVGEIFYKDMEIADGVVKYVPYNADGMYEKEANQVYVMENYWDRNPSYEYQVYRTTGWRDYKYSLVSFAYELQDEESFWWFVCNAIQEEPLGKFSPWVDKGEIILFEVKDYYNNTIGTYQAEYGMTWSEWIDSIYNDGTFTYSGNNTSICNLITTEGWLIRQDSPSGKMPCSTAWTNGEPHGGPEKNAVYWIELPDIAWAPDDAYFDDPVPTYLNGYANEDAVKVSYEHFPSHTYRLEYVGEDPFKGWEVLNLVDGLDYGIYWENSDGSIATLEMWCEEIPYVNVIAPPELSDIHIIKNPFVGYEEDNCLAYKFEWDMTIADWVDSEYNTDNWWQKTGIVVLNAIGTRVLGADAETDMDYKLNSSTILETRNETTWTFKIEDEFGNVEEYFFTSGMTFGYWVNYYGGKEAGYKVWPAVDETYDPEEEYIWASDVNAGMQYYDTIHEGSEPVWAATRIKPSQSTTYHIGAR